MFNRAKNNSKKKENISLQEIDVSDATKISERLNQLKAGTITITEEDVKAFQKGAMIIESFIYIYNMWANSKKKINKLLKMIFGNRSEKLKDLGKGKNDNKENNNGENLGKNNTSSPDNSDTSNSNANTDNKGKGKNKRNGGGGKNAADDYTSAAEIDCKLDDDKLPGEICPACNKNKLFEIAPKKVVRLVGRAPVTAFKFIQQQVRCICGAIFTADVGDEFRDIYDGDKYSPSALATIMIHKYIMGATFGKLEKIQKMSGVPVPATTQMNKIKNDALPVVQAIVQIFLYLVRNAGILAFDDTRIRTLEKRKNKKGQDTHYGHGTAIIAGKFDEQGNEIILFNFETSKHAGEVVCDLLSERERDSLPVLASDGLPAYNSSKEKGINVNCNIHARRKVIEEDPKKETFVGITVLECYKEIYTNDSYCKDNNLSDIERMNFHKENSLAHFEKIKTIFDIITGIDVRADIRKSLNIPEYLSEEEPNSGVYNVATYFLDRYKPLTRVTEVPGSPLDTNDVERIIKCIILLRKTSLFFHNNFSACYSADILSLLETADHSDVNVFEYMDYILSKKDEVLKNPHNYLPWLYLKTDEEKELYWANVNNIIKSPSSFEGSPTAESYHSSA